MVFESRLPQKIVNLLFAITDLNKKLTISGGGRLSEPIDECTVWDKIAEHNRDGEGDACGEKQPYITHTTLPILPYSTVSN